MSKIHEASVAHDMRGELQDLARELNRSALEVAWRQWRALDASASSAHAQKSLQSLVDPEALLLFSLLMKDEERRFGDIMPDWVALNSDLISVQRVKNLAADYPEQLQARLLVRLGDIAKIAVEGGKDLRWQSLLRHKRNDSGSVASHPSPKKIKNRAIRARLFDPVTLVLRLRLGLGVGVKADLICFLLAGASDWMTVKDIVYATGYTSTGVRRAADDLASARLLVSNEQQPAAYKANSPAWVDLLSLESAAPVWQNWRHRFAVVIAFDNWAKQAQNHPLSSYAFGVRGRELVEKYRRVFPFSYDDVGHSADAATFVKQNVMRLSAQMVEWA